MCKILFFNSICNIKMTLMKLILMILTSSTRTSPLQQAPTARLSLTHRGALSFSTDGAEIPGHEGTLSRLRTRDRMPRGGCPVDFFCGARVQRDRAHRNGRKRTGRRNEHTQRGGRWGGGGKLSQPLSSFSTKSLRTRAQVKLLYKA